MAIDAAIEAERIATELFRSPEGRADPYPRYHRLRELAPVHRSETLRAWVLTRYDDCWSALRDPRLGKDYVGRMDVVRPWWREHPSLARGEKSLLNVDGPYHTRLRRLVSKAFTFRSVSKLRPSVEKIVDDLIEPLAKAGGGDLIEQLAFPLPVTVIGELLGVPAPDRAQFRELVRDLTIVFEPGVQREQYEAADAATLKLDAYFYDLVAERRARPRDDLLSDLVAVNDNGDRLTDEELVTLASLLFFAGFETTTNLIGNAMVGFLRQPEQLQLLREHPDLDANLADEVLRFDGTAQMVVRQTMDEYEVDGFTIPSGDTIVAVIAAGNHDPERYEDPDRIDLTRTDVRPLSFGGGIHFCLGAALARAEVEIAFRKLVECFDVIEADGEIPSHRDRLTLRGLQSLPMVLKAEGRTRATPRSVAGPSRGRAAAPPRRPARGLPPRPRGEADWAWRAAFRRRVEGRASASTGEVDETIGLLARVPLFRGCTPAELEQLARTAYPIAFDPGDELCVEGADAPECYVIAEGEAAVRIGGKVVALAHSDDVIGEKGPLEQSPRAATVTALTHMITYAISREHLLTLAGRSPSAAAAMREELQRRYVTS